jgi:hypothetical protein
MRKEDKMAKLKRKLTVREVAQILRKNNQKGRCTIDES